MPSMLGDLKKRLGQVGAAPPPAVKPREAGLATEEQATLDPTLSEAPDSIDETLQEGQAQEEQLQEEVLPDYGRWFKPPTPAQVAAYAWEAVGYVPRGDDPVMIAEEAGVTLALEGGVIVSNACVAVRGWLVDEADKVESMYLELDGEVRVLHRSAHIFRPDVNSYTRPRQPSYQAGFSAIEPFDKAPDGPLAARLVAIVREGKQYLPVVSTRELVLSQSHHVDRLADELSTYWCSPTEMCRIARPYLRRVADADSGLEWSSRAAELVSGDVCDATVIIVVDRNIDMLVHLLAFLEMRPNHRRLGLVIAFIRPEHADRGVALARSLRSSSYFAFIRLLSPVHPVTFGAAVNRALEIAEGDVTIVCSDGVLPPDLPWIERTIELSRQHLKSVLAPTVMTFDGRSDNVAGLVDELPLDRFDWDHSATLDRLSAEAAPLAGFGVGVLAGQREFLKSARVFDASYTQMPFTFADAFHRLGGVGSDGVVSMDAVFTALILPEHYVANPSEVLWNAYALREALEPAVSVMPQAEALRDTEPATAKRKAKAKAKLDTDVEAATAPVLGAELMETPQAAADPI